MQCAGVPRTKTRGDNLTHIPAERDGFSRPVVFSLFSGDEVSVPARPQSYPIFPSRSVIFTVAEVPVPPRSLSLFPRPRSVLTRCPIMYLLVNGTGICV